MKEKRTFDGKLITKRPEGMGMTEYRRVRRQEKRALRNYLRRGQIMYLAAELVESRVSSILPKDDPLPQKIRRSYMPATRHVDREGDVYYTPMRRLKIHS